MAPTSLKSTLQGEVTQLWHNAVLETAAAYYSHALADLSCCTMQELGSAGWNLSSAVSVHPLIGDYCDTRHFCTHTAQGKAST